MTRRKQGPTFVTVKGINPGSLNDRTEDILIGTGLRLKDITDFNQIKSQTGGLLAIAHFNSNVFNSKVKPILIGHSLGDFNANIVAMLIENKAITFAAPRYIGSDKMDMTERMNKNRYEYDKAITNFYSTDDSIYKYTKSGMIPGKGYVYKGIVDSIRQYYDQ